MNKFLPRHLLERSGKRAMKTTTLCAAALVVFLPHGVVAEEWRGLVVAPEERCAPYGRQRIQLPTIR